MSGLVKREPEGKWGKKIKQKMNRLLERGLAVGNVQIYLPPQPCLSFLLLLFLFFHIHALCTQSIIQHALFTRCTTTLPTACLVICSDPHSYCSTRTMGRCSSRRPNRTSAKVTYCLLLLSTVGVSIQILCPLMLWERKNQGFLLHNLK